MKKVEIRLEIKDTVLIHQLLKKSELGILNEVKTQGLNDQNYSEIRRLIRLQEAFKNITSELELLNKADQV